MWVKTVKQSSKVQLYLCLIKYTMCRGAFSKSCLSHSACEKERIILFCSHSVCLSLTPVHNLVHLSIPEISTNVRFINHPPSDLSLNPRFVPTLPQICLLPSICSRSFLSSGLSSSSELLPSSSSPPPFLFLPFLLLPPSADALAFLGPPFSTGGPGRGCYMREVLKTVSGAATLTQRSSIR